VAELGIATAPFRNVLSEADAKEAFAADGVTVIQFNEPASGQTVFHLHFHVIPRFAGVPLKPHSGKMEDNEVLAENATRLRRALGK